MNIEIKKRCPYGVASLTLGILSIVFFLFWCISIPSGILAIVFGIKAKKMVDSKLGTAGKITGIVGLSISSAILLLYIVIIIFSLISNGYIFY